MSDRQGAVPGITVHESGSITIVGAAAVDYYRLCLMLQSVKLEAEGIKMSRRSWTAVAKRELGVKGSRQRVIEALEAEVERRQLMGRRGR
jgi:hypothetical protein